MAQLTEEDKADLLEEASSEKRRDEFAVLNMRSKVLSPLDWVDFLTQVSKLSAPDGTKEKQLIRGELFLIKVDRKSH